MTNEGISGLRDQILANARSLYYPSSTAPIDPSSSSPNTTPLPPSPVPHTFETFEIILLNAEQSCFTASLIGDPLTASQRMLMQGPPLETKDSALSALLFMTSNYLQRADRVPEMRWSGDAVLMGEDEGFLDVEALGLSEVGEEELQGKWGKDGKKGWGERNGDGGEPTEEEGEENEREKDEEEEVEEEEEHAEPTGDKQLWELEETKKEKKEREKRLKAKEKEKTRKAKQAKIWAQIRF